MIKIFLNDKIKEHIRLYLKVFKNLCRLTFEAKYTKAKGFSPKVFKITLSTFPSLKSFVNTF